MWLVASGEQVECCRSRSQQIRGSDLESVRKDENEIVVF